MDPENQFDSELCELLCSQAVSFTRIPRDQRWQWQQRWRECFCSELKARTGKWTKGGVDWNTFALGFAPCLWDEKALNAYSGCPSDDFLVVPAGNRGGAFRCRAAQLPDLTPVRNELYVFPPGLDWTMVFTHEGPIFAKREWLPST